MKSLQNKVIVVTGGSRGMGKAFALKLASEGSKVIILARTEDGLKKTVQEIQEKGFSVEYFVCDLTDQKKVTEVCQKIITKHTEIYGLINTSGISGQNFITDEEDGLWENVIQTNLTGTYYITKALSNHIENGGRIVNVSSVLGKFGVPGYAAYCTTKHGLIGFTRTLALELAPRKITVNAICPGWVNTQMSQQGMQFAADQMKITKADFWEMASQAVPLREIIEPEEIAHLVSFILNPETRNLTGQAITYDGGQVMY